MTRAILAIALVVVSLAGPARADDGVSGRAMSFGERGRDLVVTTSFVELIDKSALEALSSGFPTTVVVRIYLYRSRDELPVALAVMQSDVVYDLWDDVYLVRAIGPQGSRTTRLATRARAVEAITRLTAAPIAPLDQVAIGPHHFAALVAELNPVSDELQAEMRRWLTQRAGERMATGSSFFGSFVSVFVNPKLAAAERVVRLRSQPFFRVAR